jgi:hypothetical protein
MRRAAAPARGRRVERPKPSEIQTSS